MSTTNTASTAYGAATEGQMGLVNGKIFRQFQTANGLQNFTINGLMEISQRGDFTVSAAATHGAYYLDRIKTEVNTVTANRIVNTTSQPPGVYGSKSFRLTASSSATGYLGIIQIVENPVVLIGKTVTFSAWVKSNKTQNVRLASFWLPRTPSFLAQSSEHSGSGNWEKLTLTLTIPADVTVPGNLHVYVIAWDEGTVPVTSGEYIETTGWMLNIGSEPAPFARAGGTIGGELALCQRYCAKIAVAQVFPGFCSNTTIVQCTFTTPVPLRVNPSIIIATTITWTAYTGTSFFSSTGVPSLSFGLGNQFRFGIPSFTGLPTSTIANVFRASGDTDLLLDAEL